MCFFSSGARVVCSSDWGRLGGRVLIIWMLWSHQSKTISNEQHLILNIPCHRCTTTKPCRIISKKRHFLLNNKCISVSFFSPSLMPQWVQICDELLHTPQIITLLRQPATFLTFCPQLQVPSRGRRALISRSGKGEEKSPFGKVGCCSLRPICWVWDADFICWRRDGG